MQFVMLIYQGTTPVPENKDAWASVPEEQRKAIYAEYAALNGTPGMTAGLPLGLPEKARTVRVENGKAVTAEGPYMGALGAVGGYFVFEAESIDDAIRLAARIPAARLGGAVEVRPAEKYW
jgi:hypothetical protein